MLFVKHQAKILSILFISIFYCIECSPVSLSVDNATNTTAEQTLTLDDLIVEIDFRRVSKPTFELAESDEDIAFGSGDGEIILNLKSPLDESLTLNHQLAPAEIHEETPKISDPIESVVNEDYIDATNSTQVESNENIYEMPVNETTAETLIDQEMITNASQFNVTEDMVILDENQNTSLSLSEGNFNNSATFEINYDLTNLTDIKVSDEQNFTQIQEPSITTIEETTTNEPTKTTTVSNCPQLICHSTTFLTKVVDYEDIYEMYTPPAKCNYGRKKNNETGCDACDCAKNPEHSFKDTCAEPFCLKPCYYGSFTDENGCNTCACRTRPIPKSVYECPSLDCPTCDYGSIKDEFGCQTCVCYRPNSKESLSCPAEPQCPFGPCLYGSVLNDFGCSTCDCLKSTEYERKECPMFRCVPCKNGYYTDEHGCNTCRCKPESMSPCSQSNYNCDTSHCLHGTYLDRNGCPSCECLPDPDLVNEQSCEQKREIEGKTVKINNEYFTYPECNEQRPHEYKSKMCNETECVCLTQDGIRISDFRAPLDGWFEMHCECARMLYQMSVNKQIGYKLFCEKNGNFEDIQCSGSTCGCVTHFGDPYGPSVPIHQKHLLRCYDIYQRLFSKYIEQTTTPMTTLSPPLCIYHRQRALEMVEYDRHIPIPRCDNEGLYEPIQCDRNVKYCWCVNIHNGVELYGTSRTGEMPNCNQRG